MKRQAEMLRKHLEANGFEVTIEGSSLSESQYVEAIHEERMPERLFRIRLSNHTSRPTYDRMRGVPDYEVGNAGNAHANAETWRAALSWACRQVGIDAPRKPERARRTRFCPEHGGTLYDHGDCGWYCPHGKGHYETFRQAIEQAFV